MAPRRPRLALVLLSFALLSFSACLARRRLITRTGGSTSQILRTADTTELLEIVKTQYDAVSDFTATVDMVPGLGTAEKNQITEYKDVRGYILFRKPSDIRIMGLYPVVRNKAFDMVSDGLTFRLYLPTKNQFIVGRNLIEQTAAVKLENLRPQHFLDALLVQPVDTATSKVMLQNYTDADNAVYILYTVHEGPDGALIPVRNIWFSRIDLRLARQIIFDPDGNILTDARYTDWHVYDGVPFPKHIEIDRPRDEYVVVLDAVKVDINRGVANDKFVLDQPEGTTLQTLGANPPPPPPPAAPQTKGKNRKK
jgi:outer membrane lipoprotein-sorting protein